MNMDKLTIQQARIILHASGLSRVRGITVHSRSHYCCSPDDSELTRLVELGYFTGPHQSRIIPSDSAMFYLTSDGKKMADKIFIEIGS